MDVSSKVEVVWADNSKTIILPQVRPCLDPGHSAVAAGLEATACLLSPLREQENRLQIFLMKGFLCSNRALGKLERKGGVTHQAP